MNSQNLIGADIGRVLCCRVVKASSANWPHLEITTPNGVFHLVTIEAVISSQYLNGKLVRIRFRGHPPIGRPEIFAWPSTEIGVSAFEIIALKEYEHQSV